MSSAPDDKNAGQMPAAPDPKMTRVEKRPGVLTDTPSDVRARRIRLIIVAASLVVILLVGALVWRSRRVTETTTEEAGPVVSVRVAKAERAEIAAEVSALGTIW